MILNPKPTTIELRLNGQRIQTIVNTNWPRILGCGFAWF